MPHEAILNHVLVETDDHFLERVRLQKLVFKHLLKLRVAFPVQVVHVFQVGFLVLRQDLPLWLYLHFVGEESRVSVSVLNAVF